jgi:hypothetical protein
MEFVECEIMNKNDDERTIVAIIIMLLGLLLAMYYHFRLIEYVASRGAR